MRRLLLALALILAASPAGAERLVTQVSQDEVSITSSFAGQTLTLFGSIEPEAGALVRITPVRLVWWMGWSSGSLAVA